MHATEKPIAALDPALDLPPTVLAQVCGTASAPPELALLPTVPLHSAHTAPRRAGHGVLVLEVPWWVFVAAGPRAEDRALRGDVILWERAALAAIMLRDGAVR